MTTQQLPRQIPKKHRPRLSNGALPFPISRAASHLELFRFRELAVNSPQDSQDVCPMQPRMVQI